MVIGDDFNNAYTHFGNNNQDGIVIALNVSDWEDSTAIINAYKKEGVTPIFPIVLKDGNSQNLAALLGNVTSAGTTYILHPDREFSTTTDELSTMKSNFQKALDDDCNGVTTKYKLTVTKGSGSGDYAENAKVTVVANEPQQGYAFKTWTGATQYIADAGAANTTVTMPGKDISIKATYIDTTTSLFSLTVRKGSGSGNYSEGDEVSISAATPEDGFAFEAWIGDIEYVSNTSSATTTITMPSKNLSVEATYVDTSDSDIDTTNPVSIMTIANWNGYSDKYGSSITIDSSKLKSDSLISAKMSLTSSNKEQKEWAWVKLTAFLSNSLESITALKINYNADAAVNMVLDQANLSVAGTSYYYQLASNNSLKTELLTTEKFSLPSWYNGNEALDLSKVKSISFVAVKENTSVAFTIEDLVLYNYEPTSIGYNTIQKVGTFALSTEGRNFALIVPEKGSYILTVFGVNGRLLYSQKYQLQGGLNKLAIPTVVKAASMKLITIEGNSKQAIFKTR